MQTSYYAAVFALSLVLTVFYVSQWHRRFDVNMTALFLLIPIVNLAFLMMYRHHETDTALVAMKIVYIGGCFLPWFTTMCIVNLCRIPVSRFLRTLTFLLCCLMYCGVLTAGYRPWFYRSAELRETAAGMLLVRTYGPLHTVFYVCVALFLLANIATILYSLLRKKQVSRTILYLLFFPVAISMGSYALNHFLSGTGYEILPASYILAQIVYLLIAHRMVLYRASDMVIESLVQSGDTGFVTIDFKYRYLGSNETAKRVIPALRELTVDHTILAQPSLRDNVVRWLNDFSEGMQPDKELYTPDGGEEIYTVRVGYLYDGRKRRGYQIFLEDDTQDQKYITLLDNYNVRLEREVSEKTARLCDMHDRLILGMAAMVESRDNSTGGHIRRTSEGVRILTEEIRKDGAFTLSDAFCKNLTKAAPMHDLGKIAVDDAILRKPGRFTAEEFEIMKTHAAEGARIVHTILADTDDEAFRSIAENVAHYHHERVDGTGYPDGLRGDGIPLEARIMAVADVYDALVSKRVYKEKCSFEEADRIILGGMGTQFDARLKPCYEAARPALEAFYSSEGMA